MMLSRLAWRYRRAPRAASARAVREVMQRLSDLMGSTEAEFLQIGAQLERVRTTARQESAHLGAMSADFTREEGGSLGALLEQVAQWAAAAADGSAGSGGIDALVEASRALREPVQGMARCVRTLRVISVVTRVESARLGERAAGFLSLASELDRLAGEIDSRAETILGSLEELLGVLETAREAQDVAARSQQAQLAELVRQSDVSLGQLHAVQGRVGAAASEARRIYDRLEGTIGSIFMALQLHDSTRQRLEHVHHSLEELAEALQAKAVVQPEAVLRMLELQTAQLQEARQTFIGSMGEVRGGLGRLADGVTEITQAARQVGLDASGGQDAGLQTRCRAVGASIDEWIELRQNLLRTAGGAQEACSRMAAFTGEIESVGLRMLRLSLNSEVQAARLEASGAVVESVAQSIRGVAQDIAVCVAQAEKAMQEIARRVESLSQQADDGSRGSLAGARGLGVRLEECIERLMQVTAGERRVLASLERGGESLAAELSKLVGSIQADHVMDAAARECLTELEGLAARARAAANAGELEGPQAGLATCGARYTMQAERDVHNSVAGGPVEAAVAEAAGPGEPAESEFGANVEMF